MDSREFFSLIVVFMISLIKFPSNCFGISLILNSWLSPFVLSFKHKEYYFFSFSFYIRLKAIFYSLFGSLAIIFLFSKSTFAFFSHTSSKYWPSSICAWLYFKPHWNMSLLFSMLCFFSWISLTLAPGHCLRPWS